MPELKKLIEDVIHSQNATIFYDMVKEFVRIVVNKDGKVYMTKYYEEEKLMRVMWASIVSANKEAIDEYSTISGIPHDIIGTIFFLEDTVAKSI